MGSVKYIIHQNRKKERKTLIFIKNQEARQKASDISGTLTTLIRNANGTLNATALIIKHLLTPESNIYKS